MCVDITLIWGDHKLRSCTGIDSSGCVYVARGSEGLCMLHMHPVRSGSSLSKPWGKMWAMHSGTTGVFQADNATGAPCGLPTPFPLPPYP